MALCGASRPLAYGDSIVCDRQVNDSGEHIDDPLGPPGEDGKPVEITPEQHYFSVWQTTFTV